MCAKKICGGLGKKWIMIKRSVAESQIYEENCVYTKGTDPKIEKCVKKLLKTVWRGNKNKKMLCDIQHNKWITKCCMASIEI
jgi:hypothetical protein